jgi:hypothetical protein
VKMNSNFFQKQWPHVVPFASLANSSSAKCVISDLGHMDGEKRCQQIPHRETGLPHHVRCLSLFFSRGEPSNHWLPDPCVAHMIDIRSWTLISWVFLQPPPKVAPAMIDATSGRPQGTNLPTFFGWFKSKIGWFNPRKTTGFPRKPAYNEFANYPFPRSHATLPVYDS